MIKTKTVFLDRDGVITRKMPEGDYVKCWGEFEFLPGAKEALRLLRRAGGRVIVVTNQRGIARGVMTERDLQKIHEHMLSELAQVRAQVDAIYYCPHDEGQCDCRKPKTGMFLRAKRDFPEIDFANSFVIGDSLSDLEAGAQLGCRNILIADDSRRDGLIKSAYTRGITIDGVAPSLFEAVIHCVLPAR